MIRLDSLTYQLPGALERAITARIEEARRERWIERVWAHDASLWTGRDEHQWLGWLDAPERAAQQLDSLESLARAVAEKGITEVLLLGMGGSSLAPEVLASVLGAPRARLRILDSTHPDQIRAIEATLDPTRTLIVTSSKSGTTLETKLLGEHFFAHVERTLGRSAAAERFVAITDPGSQLEKSALGQQFWRIVHGEPSIGGRFSALSPFGLVPSAVSGHDVRALIGAALAMAQACRAPDSNANHPGMVLGVILGEAARAGRDKLTLVPSGSVASLGAWLEQLIAESLGKDGKAIIPIDAEPALAPEQYGADRLFVQLVLEGDTTGTDDARLDHLATLGHPVVRIRLTDRHAIAQEFFRWSFATAIAGVVMNIHPFDQPDVEASKAETRRLMSAGTGADGGADDPGHSDLASYGDSDTSVALRAALRQLFASIRPGDYFGILAYVPMTESNRATLARLRAAVTRTCGVAGCLQFGPRFLHSTGQAYKGGSNRGVFLVITDGATADVPASASGTSFAAVIAAQASGDSAVLRARGRRVLRVASSRSAERDLSSLVEAAQAVLLEAHPADQS